MFWGIWIIIPFVWELLAGFISMAVATAEFLKKDRDSPAYAPEVSILIPVHNSQKTLKNCLASIAAQEYPKEKMEVVLIDNGSRDKSYEVFRAFQEGQPELRLWWVESEKGKANALNKGIFGSKGKYIINIDSDGCLDKQAVKNVVARFEADDRIACMTGVVLVDPGLIEKSGSRLLKTLRRCELFEYTESFLVGRNYQSVFNSMYTMAGAFSCFRRETLMKTQLYNSETLGEDAHMSFQIKDFAGGRMLLCENAFFFVDPIESLDKLYIQRQRWQRAELEVARLFTHMHLGGIKGFLKSPSMRSLISDHTLTFPKLIWLFAMFCLYFMNYPLTLLLGANFLIILRLCIHRVYLSADGFSLPFGTAGRTAVYSETPVYLPGYAVIQVCGLLDEDGGNYQQPDHRIHLACRDVKRRNRNIRQMDRKVFRTGDTGSEERIRLIEQGIKIKNIEFFKEIMNNSLQIILENISKNALNRQEKCDKVLHNI